MPLKYLAGELDVSDCVCVREREKGMFIWASAGILGQLCCRCGCYAYIQSFSQSVSTVPVWTTSYVHVFLRIV